MSFKILQVVILFLGGTILSSPGVDYKTEGYRSVISYGDGFIAAGSDGRIDWYSVSGRKIKEEKFPGETFNCLLEYNQMVIAAGESGSMLISSDEGPFRKVETGTVRDINSLAEFGGIIIAGADHGEIITGDGSGPFRINHLDVKGNIVSVSARASDCYGVTDEGEVIHTKNGKDWEITDLNKVYSGYYKPSSFIKVLVTDNRVAITGVHDDGSPVVLYSSLGKVWTQRTLNYTDDQGIARILTGKPNDIYYDAAGDQFFIICSNGEMMVLPSCTQCNKLAEISGDNLTGIACSGNTFMIVGDNFFIKSVNLR